MTEIPELMQQRRYHPIVQGKTNHMPNVAAHLAHHKLAPASSQRRHTVAPLLSCTRTSKGGAGALGVSHSAPARFLRLSQSDWGPLTCTAATEPWKPTCCTN